MKDSVRDGHNRFGAIVMRALLSVAALIVLVLGPFMVQCRAPNGTMAAKFLFSECSPDVGCCDRPHVVAEPQTANAETDFRIMDCGGGPCGGCAENALFSFVGGRGSRDEGKLIGSIPCVMAEVHPASKLTAEIVAVSLADATFLEVPLSSDEIHRILRI